MPKCSLIISVYNQVKELELILSALSIQNFRDFEVIIADDGSKEKMAGFINDYSKQSPFNIIHIKQDDKGFRKNKILNKAVKRSNTKYLIFIDGDCIPHSEFVYQHYHNKHTGAVLCGRRVNLSKKLSDNIDKENILSKKYEKFGLKHIYDSMKPDKKSRSTWIEEGLLIKNRVIRNLYFKNEPKIVGCNFSLHKETLMQVNGFDENYTGPGFGEDADIEFRLRLSGVKFKTLRNLAILYHLYHPAAKRSEQNHAYYKEVLKSSNPVCKKGLEKLD